MNRLRELRQERGLSLRELDTKLRELDKNAAISFTALGQAERGLRTLNNNDLKVLTEFFGVSADYLLGFSDDKTPPQNQLKGTQLALYNGTKDLTDEQLNEILNFVEFVKSKK